LPSHEEGLGHCADRTVAVGLDWASDARRISMELPDFLTRRKFGEIRLSGHRIGLFHVVERYQGGESPERIQEEFPSLSLEEIRKVLAFYQDNQAEVDAYVTACRAEIERQEAASRQGPDIAELRRRFTANQP
jgi:uncharacterized protein (DUF433 family)